VLTVPPPTMLSCEVQNANATKEEVEVSTWRFKRLNQDLLVAAHKKAETEARRQMLSPEQMEEIRKLTREQLERLVKALIVDDKPLEVRFEETPESTASGS
jgi:formate dehydrogenase maturation protein FdhE